MNNPVLVEALRGALVESRHRASVAVMDADGGVVLSLGDVGRPVFPRSAVKAFQALPLIETGAADRYGLTPAEIAQACASHSGEPGHAALSAAMLGKAGRDETCLECGAQWPMDDAAKRSLARFGREPSALHNNCSGKHAGFVCLSCHLGEDPKGYVSADHPVQRAVKVALEEMTGTTLDAEVCGTDGCSIPTYAIPLTNLALGFARFGTGAGLSRDRAAACARIRAAVGAHPWHVAGTGRFDTRIMEAFGRRIFTKTGAEGVFCAALPERGLGIALKVDDGATRASEVVMASLIGQFLEFSDYDRERLEPFIRPTLRNWNGIEVGQLRPAGALAEATRRGD